MSEQDLTTCICCGYPMTHVPKLGEKIMHEKCQSKTKEYFDAGVRLGRTLPPIERQRK